MAKKSLSEILTYTAQLSEKQQLELISRISIRLLGPRVKKAKRRSWMEMAGHGAEVWKDIDAQEYVNKERESWGE